MVAKLVCISRNKVFSGHINNQLDGEPPDAAHLAEPPAASIFGSGRMSLKQSVPCLSRLNSAK